MTAIPTCSVRDTFAFLRDACLFSGDRGLGYGDLYRVRLPGHDLLVVTDPGLIREILAREGEHFEKSRVYWRELRRVLGDAMGSIEGHRWRYLRQRQQPFFSPRTVHGILPAAHAVTSSQLDRLASSVEDEGRVSISEVLSELNIRILLSTLFGDSRPEAPEGMWRRIVDGEATIAWRSKFPWRPWTAWVTGANQRARRHRAFFGAYAEELSRKASTVVPGTEVAPLLSVLLAVNEEPDAPRFPDTLVRNEIVVHLGAGTETQGTAEGWILYLLWKHPEVLDRMRAEIETVTAGALVAPGHLTSLTFTRQVIREGLRLYPPSYALVRDCVRSTVVGEHELKRGQVIFISLYALHRNPRLWEQPERFDPDRFGPKRVDRIGRYQYLPFGAGRHVCIGQHLAMPCMMLTLGQFAQRFDWRFEETDVRPIGLSTLKPAVELTAALTCRR